MANAMACDGCALCRLGETAPHLGIGCITFNVLNASHVAPSTSYYRKLERGLLCGVCDTCVAQKHGVMYCGVCASCLHASSVKECTFLTCRQRNDVADCDGCRLRLRQAPGCHTCQWCRITANLPEVHRLCERHVCRQKVRAFKLANSNMFSLRNITQSRKVLCSIFICVVEHL